MRSWVLNRSKWAQSLCIDGQGKRRMVSANGKFLEEKEELLSEGKVVLLPWGTDNRYVRCRPLVCLARLHGTYLEAWGTRRSNMWFDATSYCRTFASLKASECINWRD